MGSTRVMWMLMIMMMLQTIQCITDCETVVAIYKAMGGKEFDVDRPCGIQGVTIDDHGRVVEIYWNFKGLQGSIPPEIGDLRHLRFL